MPPISPIEFVRRALGDHRQPCGNRVQLEDANANANSVSNPLYVLLVGGGDGATPQELLTDEITGALVNIDLVHHEAHEGELFSAGYIVPHASPVADNGTIDIRFVTGAKYCHAIALGSFGGDFEGYLYEDTTFTAPGTQLTIQNHKRVGGEATTAEAYHTPTVNAIGTLLDGAFVPGGSRNFAAGAAQGQRSEWILKPNSNYLYRLTNRAGNAQQGSLWIIWYEESDN